MSQPKLKGNLWPKEHGALTQLLFPLVTVFALASQRGRVPLNPQAMALGAGALMLFLSMEPLRVLLGRRGERKQVAWRKTAKLRMALWLGTSTLAYVYGLAGCSVHLLVWSALPAALGALTLLLFVRGLERNIAGEMLAALSLTGLSLPVGLRAGVSDSHLAIALGVWSVVFILGTLCARAILIRAKDKGRLLRAVGAVSVLVMLMAPLGLYLDLVLAPLLLGPVGFASIALWLSLTPPSPKKMTRVGVGLAMTSFATFGSVLVAIG